MVERIHHGLGSLIWRAMIVSIILLAIYVTGTRALLQALPQIQPQLVAELSRRFSAEIRVGGLSGDVVGFAPQISLDDVHVRLPGDAGFVIDLSGASFTVDPWASLTALEPRLDSLRLEGSSVSVGVGSYAGEEGDADLSILGDLLRVFRKVTVSDSRIELLGRNHTRLVFGLGIELRRDGSQRQFRVRLSENEQNYFAFEGSGVGNLLDPDNFAGEIHGELRSQRIGDIASLFSDLGINGSADLDFWYRVQNSMPSLTVSAVFGDLALERGPGDSLSFESLSTQALLRPTDQGWVVWLEQLHAESGGAGVELNRLRLENRGRSVRVALTDLDVGNAAQVVLASGVLQGDAQDIVAELNPTGSILALQASIEDLSDPLARWSASAEVLNASTQPTLNVPGLYGIDATLEGTQDGATAWIDTEVFGLDLRGIYDEPIRAERVRGRLSAHWQRDALFLKDGELALTAADHEAMVQFGIDIPFTDAASKQVPLAMYLDVGLTRAPVSIRRHYIPAIIPRDLYNWLDSAIEQGNVEQGAFVWRGGFEDFGGGDQSMQLGLALSQGVLAFQHDWPAVEDLSASVLVDTDRVSVWGPQGTISGLAVSHVSVELDGDPRVSLMRIRGDGTGGADAALSLLRNSPVNDIAGEVLADLDAAGRLNGTVSLEFGLDNLGEDPQVLLALDMVDTTLSSEIIGLDLTGVSGDLAFDLNSGFSSQKLTANLFEQPLEVAIGPGTTGLSGANVLDARFAGRLSAEHAQPWLGAISGLGSEQKPFDLHAQGETLVTVDLAVGEEANIRVSSDLQGMGLDLPAPIGKRAEQKTPFVLELQTGDAPWEAFWYRRLQGRFYRHEGHFVGANIDVTPRRQRSQLNDSPMTEGVFVSGKMSPIQLEPWLAVWDEFDVPEQDSSHSTPVIIERLGVESVIFGGVDVGPVNVDLTPFDTWDMLGVNAEWLDAELTLRHDGLPSSLIINSLNLDLLPEFAGKTLLDEAEALPENVQAESLDPLMVGQKPEPEPPELTAPLVVIVANVKYHETDLGAATFTVTSGGGVLEASNIRGNLADIGLLDGSQLVWQRDEATGAFDTRLILNGDIENLGHTFEALDIDPAVETRSGKLAANLSWPGGPEDIDLMALSGTVDVQLREGSFLPVPAGATGFVRILSVLNLAGLFERANVTRLFEPGVAFKKAQGQLQFQPGRIEIPDFTVDGPGGGFRIDSDIDLVSETIDGELIVTLPLAENIPWVAALAGGLPVAAGVYLVSKVFEDQVKSLSSGVYSVTGPLASPDVKFVRVFDATSNKVREGDGPEGEASSEPQRSSEEESPTDSRASEVDDQSSKVSSENSPAVSMPESASTEGDDASSSSRK